MTLVSQSVREAGVQWRCINKSILVLSCSKVLQVRWPQGVSAFKQSTARGTPHAMSGKLVLGNRLRVGSGVHKPGLSLNLNINLNISFVCVYTISSSNEPSCSSWLLPLGAKERFSSLPDACIPESFYMLAFILYFHLFLYFPYLLFV